MICRNVDFLATCYSKKSAWLPPDNDKKKKRQGRRRGKFGNNGTQNFPTILAHSERTVGPPGQDCGGETLVNVT